MRLRLLFIVTAFGALASAPAARAATDCNGLAPTQAPGTAAGELILGTAGDDVILAEGGDDTVAGLGGVDVICGGDGEDTIFGGDSSGTSSGGTELDVLIGDADDDTLVGELGGDVIAGFTGADGVLGGPGNDSIFGGDSTGTASGGTDADTLLGEDGGDSIFGEFGDDLIDGEGGNDTLHGMPGDDFLFGGSDPDVVSYENSATGVDVDLGAGSAVGEGTDTLDSIATAVGSVHDDDLTGDDGRNGFIGLAGDDDFAGEADEDVVVFIAPVIADLGLGTASGEGSDTLTGIENLTGSSGDDSLTGDGVANELDGGAGGDQLAGNGGNDFFTADPGDDDIGGGEGSGDVISFESATDEVFVDLAAGTSTTADPGPSGVGSDTLSGIEDVFGSLHDDEILGSGAQNRIWGLGGGDVMDGGGGSTDRVLFSLAEAPVQVDLAAGTASGEGADALAGFEQVRGSSFSDVIEGDAGPNVLAGGEGDDVLDGRGNTDTVDYQGAQAGVTVDLAAGTGSGADSGADTLIGIEQVFGTPFDDTLLGDSGSNGFYPFAGDDEVDGRGQEKVADGISYEFAAGSVSVDLAAGTASGAEDDDTIAGVENVIGSEFDDALFGDEANNGVAGLGGDDALGGRGGDADLVIFDGAGGVEAHLAGGTAIGNGQDTLAGFEAVSGTEGNDLLTGDAAVNLIHGNGGDDVLYGRGGGDLMAGDGGADTVVGGESAFDQVSYLGSEEAVVVDLSAGEATVGEGPDAEVDTIFGLEVVFGSSGDDTLLGDAGENTFFTGAGSDVVDGGPGIDVVGYYATTDPEIEGAVTFDSGPVQVDLAAGTGENDVEPGDVDSLTRVEDVWGSDAPDGDILVGDDRVNLLLGGAGDDELLGGGGNDSLSGEAGDDTLRGQAGNRDFTYYSFAQSVDVDLGDGIAEVVGDKTVDPDLSGCGGSGPFETDTDTLGGLEAVGGSECGGDRLVGSGRRDILLGRAGPDDLFGRAGSDALDGGDGSDLNNGNAGYDYCVEPRRENCEETAFPDRLRAEIRQLIAQILRDIKRRRGVRLSG